MVGYGHEQTLAIDDRCLVKVCDTIHSLNKLCRWHSLRV